MVFPRGTDPAWIPEQRGPVPLMQHLRACTQQFLSLHKSSTTRVQSQQGCSAVWPPQGHHPKLCTRMSPAWPRTPAPTAEDFWHPGAVLAAHQLWTFFRETTKKPLSSSGERCPPRSAGPSTQRTTRTKPVTTCALGKLQPQNNQCTCAHFPEGIIQVKFTPISIFSMPNNLHNTSSKSQAADIGGLYNNIVILWRVESQ